MFHFDLPQGLIDQYKGFVSRRCIEDFVNYAHVCFESFGDRVPYLLTINEQDVIANIPFFNGLIDINHSFQLGWPCVPICLTNNSDKIDQLIGLYVNS